jgi:glutaminyl-tRNA synthetase
VKGTIHWLSAHHAIPAELRLYDRLFLVPDPDDDADGRSYRDHLNPDAVRIVQGYVEPALLESTAEDRYQFERVGYFVADRRDYRMDAPVFPRTVGLRDSWARAAG